MSDENQIIVDVKDFELKNRPHNGHPLSWVLNADDYEAFYDATTIADVDHNDWLLQYIEGKGLTIRLPEGEVTYTNEQLEAVANKDYDTFTNHPYAKLALMDNLITHAVEGHPFDTAQALHDFRASSRAYWDNIMETERPATVSETPEEEAKWVKWIEKEPKIEDFEHRAYEHR